MIFIAILFHTKHLNYAGRLQYIGKIRGVIKMRKKIIFGSLLAVFLMVMLPSACAVESNAVKEPIESRRFFEVQNINIDIEKLIEKITDNSGEPLFILTLLILLLRAIRGIVWIVGFVILSIIKNIIGNNNTTACIIS